jgi:predicted methyltransferase
MTLTQKVHEFIKGEIHSGALVVDATVGNGHDTCFLAEVVAEQGHVYGFDIQQQAITSTTQRLEKLGLAKRVSLFQLSHHRCNEVLPSQLYGKISLIVFNLGYLPHGDKTITTNAQTTCAAVDVLIEMLAHNGVISLVAYRGHPGGEEEYQSIMKQVCVLSAQHYAVQSEISDENRCDSPVWIVIRRL